MPSQASEPVKCAERYRGRPVVADLDAAGDVGGQHTKPVQHGVIDRLRGGMECQTDSADVSESARSHPYAP